MRDILDFILCLPYMLTMWLFLAWSKCQEIYYNWRKISYKRTNEGFVVRIKK